MTKLFAKTLKLDAVVAVGSGADASYWLKKEFEKQLRQIEEFGDVVEVDSVKDLPAGYGLDDYPDNDQDETIGEIIAPRGVESMRRALDDD